MIDVTSVKRRSGGTWVAISAVYKRLSGAWVQVWPTDPPISITGSGSYNSTGAVGGVSRTKSITTALSVSGGNGTYSYSWAFVAGSGDNVVPSSTTILNPTFSEFLAPDASRLGTYRLTVTSGSQTATKDITYNLAN